MEGGEGKGGRGEEDRENTNDKVSRGKNVNRLSWGKALYCFYLCMLSVHLKLLPSKKFK